MPDRGWTGPRELNLMPGELFFGAGVPSLRTLIGSCVAVTLWNPRHRIGGMCHYLLPNRQRPANEPRDGKFGDEAIGMLVDALKRAGTKPADFEAHIYGGADTMPELERTNRNIGERNIEMGWSLIDQFGFGLVGVDVGDNVPRIVRMSLIDGSVEMRRGQPIG
ncbi:MAG: chemotaxis protein [Burkholderiales bacterium PBB6]|nr:MAG: chemotaxis protein [Burkholderiales bacterium PBB6]